MKTLKADSKIGFKIHKIYKIFQARFIFHFTSVVHYAQYNTENLLDTAPKSVRGASCGIT